MDPALARDRLRAEAHAFRAEVARWQWKDDDPRAACATHARALRAAVDHAAADLDRRAAAVADADGGERVRALRDLERELGVVPLQGPYPPHPPKPPLRPDADRPARRALPSSASFVPRWTESTPDLPADSNDELRHAWLACDRALDSAITEARWPRETGFKHHGLRPASYLAVAFDGFEEAV
jgi:hypothetical protein